MVNLYSFQLRFTRGRIKNGDQFIHRRSLLSVSSKSSNGVVSVWHLVGGVFVVDAFPLIVVKVMVVDVSVNDWLPHVHEEEQGDGGVGESNPVAREADIEVAIALVGGEGSPPALVAGLHAECALLLPQTWNVLVDLYLQLGGHFVTLYHVDDLLLLLINVREGRSNLWQVLVDVVLHIYNYYIIN